MALTDLTNTSWRWNDLLGISSAANYSINFETAAGSRSALQTTLTGILKYGTQPVYSQDFWLSTSFKVIKIVGGTDVTNADLISFIQDNATQITLSSLSNTTWEINSVICDAGYGVFDVTYDIDDYSIQQTQLGIGYFYSVVEDDWISEADQTAAFSSLLPLEVGTVLSFAGGTDISNVFLISWLQLNATQTAAPDLSHTKWRLNQSVALSNVGTFAINFKSNNINYTGVTIASNGLSYGSTLVYGSSDYSLTVSYTNSTVAAIACASDEYGENWEFIPITSGQSSVTVSIPVEKPYVAVQNEIAGNNAGSAFTNATLVSGFTAWDNYTTGDGIYGAVIQITAGPASATLTQTMFENQ